MGQRMAEDDVDWKTCEHREYKICNEEPDWIDAYCNACGARLIFNLRDVEPPDE
jgi:hypothetical protein